MGPLAINTTPEEVCSINLQKLRDTVKEKGQELHAQWTCTVRMRNNGKSAGSFDVYYISPAGRRFRSRAEVMVELGLVSEEDHPRASSSRPGGSGERRRRSGASGSGRGADRFGRLSSLLARGGPPGEPRPYGEGAVVELLMNKRHVSLHKRPDTSAAGAVDAATQVDRGDLERCSDMWVEYLKSKPAGAAAAAAGGGQLSSLPPIVPQPVPGTSGGAEGAASGAAAASGKPPSRPRSRKPAAAATAAADATAAASTLPAAAGAGEQLGTSQPSGTAAAGKSDRASSSKPAPSDKAGKEGGGVDKARAPPRRKRLAGSHDGGGAESGVSEGLGAAAASGATAASRKRVRKESKRAESDTSAGGGGMAEEAAAEAVAAHVMAAQPPPPLAVGDAAA